MALLERKASFLSLLGQNPFRSKESFEPNSYLPLRKRVANEIIDGYIHMPHEVISLAVSGGESLTVIQGVLCLSINRPVTVDRLCVNVKGEASTRFFNGQEVSQNPVLEEEDEGICLEQEDHDTSNNRTVSRKLTFPSILSKNNTTRKQETLSKQSITFLNIHQPIIEHQQSVFEARCHYVPFEFCVGGIENKLPPSFKGKHGHITYKVEATLDSSDLPTQSYFTSFTFLIRRCDTIPSSTMLTVPSHYRSQIVSNILYKFVLPTVFFPKEKYSQVKLDIWRLRPGALLPSSVSFHIREVQKYRSEIIYPMEHYKNKTEKVITINRRLKTVSLTPGEDKSLNVTCTTLLWLYNSLGLHPTTECPLVSVEHTLVVQFHFGWREMSGIVKPHTDEFPIKLQSLPRSLFARPGPPTYIQPPAYTP